MAARLWIEERDKPVWHRALKRVASLDYVAACGWELSAREGRVWPQKPRDPGPAAATRCHTCVGDEPD